MIIPDDQSLQYVAIGGGAIAIFKIASNLWRSWLDAKQDTREDREGKIVDAGYQQLVADLRVDNARLMVAVEKLNVALELQRDQIIELEQKLYHHHRRKT